MNVDNVGIAGEAVGQRHTSNTTHVFYVAGNSDDTNSDAGKLKGYLEALLPEGGAFNTDAEDAFKKPYGEEESGNGGEGGNG
jgi:DNA-binding LacI/PurR family transcriptional regulator